jgi:hypothetical protein
MAGIDREVPNPSYIRRQREMRRGLTSFPRQGGGPRTMVAKVMGRWRRDRAAADPLACNLSRGRASTRGGKRAQPIGSISGAKRVGRGFEISTPKKNELKTKLGGTFFPLP